MQPDHHHKRADKGHFVNFESAKPDGRAESAKMDNAAKAIMVKLIVSIRENSIRLNGSTVHTEYGCRLSDNSISYSCP